MSENNKSYRIRTEINSESPFYINVNLNQDYKNFEILSLNLDSESLYKMFTSEYGCIVGRVLANDSLGIPNAKISVFIPTSESNDIDPILYSLYPYTSTLDKNEESIRYNTLPDEIVNSCHQAVGTFPNKRLVLDDNNMLEIFDKYYKYTTITNESGDYMIYGVPVGEQTVHVDIDLSDIGELSQRPIDMMYKGYDKTQFESASMFNKSTDLDKLTQIFSQNHQVFVNPFWGDDESQQVSITRCDISIQYKFEPTCIFIGSIVTDSNHAGFSKKCVPSPDMGNMDNLVGTSGTIEIIRKTQGNNVESLVIQGTQLIDGSGRWCFQIPMNLDYVGTDEYGNRVATNDPNKGVPTRTRVRFRISSSHESDSYSDLHISKVLVPHNPKTIKDIDYAFGDKTKDNDEATLSFRDLFKDNVYTVKSYIPRIQKGSGQRSTKFSGIKNVTDSNGSNEIPYNNMRVNITFMFVLQCALLKLLIKFITYANQFLSSSFWYTIWNLVVTFVKVDMGTLRKYTSCITLGDAVCPDMEGWYYAPGCDGKTKYKIAAIGGLAWLFGNKNKEELKQTEPNEKTPLKRTLDNNQWADQAGVDLFSIDFGNDDGGAMCISNNINYLEQCVEVHLAMEHNVIQFDFYNDWINGTIYIPKWFATVKKKRSYLFGLIKRPEKIQACMEDSYSKTRNLTQQCALTYKDRGDGTGIYNIIDLKNGCRQDKKKKQKCHKREGRRYVKILGNNGGVVHREETMRLDHVYYLRPMELYNEKLVYLFATDIVLLGSINQNNIYGIPYVFNGLTSSSYKFPTLLPMTNLQEESTQYTACTETDVNTTGVSPTYAQDEDANDGPEYMYTEFAGVDWGFVGPGQGGQGVNNFDKLYFPGGHFLGISCFNSETNIKSCVNLSRACEIGTTFSQFTEIPYTGKTGTDDQLLYKQYNANGLISRREVSDSDYRNIFATLNFNELKTVPNNKTLQREHQFLSNFSYNFDGVLQEQVDNDAYKEKRDLIPLTTAPIDEDGTAYGTAFERYDIDYYRFRFGTFRGPFRECFVGEERNIDGNLVVYMPIYNNSFYFYFGINNGSTAFDKLYDDYYSLCTNSKNTTPSIEISNVTNNDFCEEDEGTATIDISQLSSVYKIYFKYKKSNESNYRSYNLNDFIFEDNMPVLTPFTVGETCNKTYSTNGGNTSLISIYKQILFKDLLNGDYIIFIQMLGDSYEYKAEFSINRKGLREDPDLREIIDSITTMNFKRGIVDTFERNESNKNLNGYISLINIGASVEQYQILDITRSEIICVSDKTINEQEGYPGYFENDTETGKYKFYVPSGDTKYYINMQYNCPKDSTCGNTYLTTDVGYTVSYGEIPFDYYFTNPLMEGRILRKALTDSIGMNKLNGETNAEWYINEKLTGITTNVIGDPYNDDEYSASRLAWLEYAIIYDKSLFEVVEEALPIEGGGSESGETQVVDCDYIDVGFSTIDGVEPKYNIYGNDIEITGTGFINIEEITKLESLSSLSDMPIYLPTSNIVSTTVDDETKLSVDHYFENYLERLISLGFTPKFNNMIIPEIRDYELEIIIEDEIEPVDIE